MCLLDGSTYFALIGPRPVIVDGKVVAALSIGHDFAAYARQAGGSDTDSAGAGRAAVGRMGDGMS